MSKEVKVGLVAIAALLLTIWGYKFVKGQNIFNKTQEFYTTFDDVTALPNSAPLLLNGYKIGQITEIKLNPKDVNQMNVYVRVEGNIPVPKDARLVMKSEGLVGGKLLMLEFDKPCTGGDCAESGTFLKGQSLGLLGSMMGDGELNSYLSGATGDLQKLLTNLGKEGQEGKLNDIIRNLDVVVASVAKLSASSNSLVLKSDANITATLKNIEAISKNLANNNAQITSALNNITKVTSDLAKANLDQTVTKTNGMVDNATITMKELTKTLNELEKTVAELNGITAGLNSGKGTAGKLLTDQALYENLNSTTKQLNFLLQDLRLNPKRYINVSVFGKKKEKAYVVPEEDPVLNSQENK